MSEAMPGTLIEIKDISVRKDMSFMLPQIKFIDDDLKRLYIINLQY
jgi:hypothetical protein